MLKKLLSLNIGQQSVWDTSALGGLPLYGVVTLMFLLFGYKQVFWQLLLGLILIYALLVVVRYFYFKPRPMQQKYTSLLEKIDASSFPSLHAMRITVLVLIVGKFFESTYVNLLLTLAVIAVCIARVLLKKHYWTDVGFGVVFGLIIGYLVRLVL